MARTDPVVPLCDPRDRNLNFSPLLNWALDRVPDCDRYVLGTRLTGLEQVRVVNLVSEHSL